MIANCADSAHAIASAPEQGPPSVPSLETWYVATSSGTRAMTLDELDDALARGQVDASTRLWIPGMAEWEALGSVANLEDGSPLECTPGAMLEYGLDAERAHQNEDGSVRPSVGDIRDYDPFSFPPPASDIPDPNRALWASILPPAPQPEPSPVRLRVEPWWRAVPHMPWVGLILSGTFVLCMSLLGAARLMFTTPAAVQLNAKTLALAPPLAATAEPLAATADPLAATAEPLAPATSAESLAGNASREAPTLVRYDEPERAPAARAARASRVDKAASQRKPARQAAKKRAPRSATRR